MSAISSDITRDSLIDEIINELKRRGANSEVIERAKELLSREESKRKF